MLALERDSSRALLTAGDQPVVPAALGAAARGACSNPAPSQQQCGAVLVPRAPWGAGRVQCLLTATTRPVSLGDQTEPGGTWRGLC